MPNIAGVLTRSIVMSSHERLESKRRREISRIHNPAKRYGALVLHELAVHFPDQVTSFLGLEVSNSEIEYVDCGTDVIVYRKEDAALKVHRRSLITPHTEHHVIASNKTKRHQMLRDSLADYTLPQETAVGFHPKFESLKVVVTEQQYVDNAHKLALFHPGTINLKDDALQEISANAEISSQLGDFAHRSLLMNSRNGIVPDIVGRGNLALYKRWSGTSFD